MHASAIVHEGKAVLFTGISGAGKSTTANAFRLKGYKMLTDDVCPITFINGKKEGKMRSENRYYISSLDQDAAQHNLIVRHHWGIENKLHWVLDVAFREDDSRMRKGYSP